MEAESLPETSVTNQRPTGRHIQWRFTFHQQCCENITSQN